jgi:hypothetical protein
VNRAAPLPSLQAAFVGVTQVFDVKEAMEKRVLSRFSHRKILVPQLLNAEEGLSVLSDLLSLPSEGWEGQEAGMNGARATFNKADAAAHNARVTEALANHDVKVWH